MIIRIILLTVIATIGYYAFIRRHRGPVHIVLLMAMVFVAAVCVLFPEMTNTVAHAVGVGRGVDLINYLVQVGLLFVVLHFGTKFVDLQEEIVTLTREVAMLRADLEEARRGETPS